MISTVVTTIKLHYDMAVPMADAIHYMPARPTLLVQVHTNAGITGLGEAAAYGGALAGIEAIMLNELRQTILGQDPFRVERLWSMMATRAHQRGRRGMLMMAISSFGPFNNERWYPGMTWVPEALATGNFDLRTHCRVVRVLTDGDGHASGVEYIDANGDWQIQPAHGYPVQLHLRKCAPAAALGRSPAPERHGQQRRPGRQAPDGQDMVGCFRPMPADRLQPAHRAIGPDVGAG